MRKYVLLLVTLFLSCPGGASKPEGETDSVPEAVKRVDVPGELKRFVYPKSAVEKVLVGERTVGMVMRTGDDVRKVAEFYLKNLGKPDDRVVNSWAVSYLYSRENVMIHIERDEGGSVISVSLVK